MEIFEQNTIQSVLFFTLYGITAAVPFMAALYLLLRRGNAFAPDITPPLRLRRWTSAFFAVSTLVHVWWLLFYIYAGSLLSIGYLMIVMLDSVLMFTTFSGMLLAMLQDRHRPVWPALVGLIPFLALGGTYMIYPHDVLISMANVYLLLLSVGFMVYMVVAIRQYGRWLNDNYADLENKKVWLSQTEALVCMLLFVLYVVSTDMNTIWIMHVCSLVVFALLLWRVETLPELEEIALMQKDAPSEPENANRSPLTTHKSPVTTNIDLDQIEQLLKEHCVATQLYLQHDLTIQQLSQAIGTNRYYLSQYFSRQSITYNTYINNLRINHFINLYQEFARTQQPFTAQQLAIDSGYRSYSTFSLAFKQRTGQSVSAWMRQPSE